MRKISNSGKPSSQKLWILLGREIFEMATKNYEN
jgi:hypothetical protein